jgi:hypothetical protein
MMKRLQELQDQVAEAQSSLEEEVVEASVGGGAVVVEMTGAQELRSISIEPEVLDPDDVEMLEDLILAAFKEAQEKSQQLAADKLGPLTGGVDIPGLM